MGNLLFGRSTQHLAFSQEQLSASRKGVKPVSGKIIDYASAAVVSNYVPENFEI
jgi:hypothetical protein